MLDFFVVCMAIVGVCTVAAGFIVLAVDISLRSKPRGGERRLKIPADCPKTDHDFIVDLECPDGTVVRVAIPSDSDSYEGRCSRTYDEHALPVGLNFIFPGHDT